MTERYGPQTVQVEALLDRVRNLTEKETEALGDAWKTRQHVAQDVAWYADRFSARDVAWTAILYAAREAVWDPAWDAWCAVCDAVSDAVNALVVRDLLSLIHI